MIFLVMPTRAQVAVSLLLALTHPFIAKAPPDSPDQQALFPNTDDMEDLVEIDIVLDGENLRDTLRKIGVVLTKERDTRTYSSDDPSQPLVPPPLQSYSKRSWYIAITVLTVAVCATVIGILAWKDVI